MQDQITTLITEAYRTIDWLAVAGAVGYLAYTMLVTVAFLLLRLTVNGVYTGAKAVVLAPWRVHAAVVRIWERQRMSAIEAEYTASLKLRPSEVGRCVLRGLDSSRLVVGNKELGLAGAFTIRPSAIGDWEEWSIEDAIGSRLTGRDEELITERVRAIRAQAEADDAMLLAMQIEEAARDGTAHPSSKSMDLRPQVVLAGNSSDPLTSAAEMARRDRAKANGAK